MKIIFVAALLLTEQVVADLSSFGEMLMSDVFAERQTAEKNLIKWSREKDTEKRADAIFQRYLITEDPEEFHRLSKILLDVHFEQKKSTIPQRGPGFIGISMAQGLVQRLEKGGLQRLEEPREGVVVQAVIPATPAEKAGLKVGDIITEINGEGIAGESPSQRLKEIVGVKTPGTTIKLKVKRDDQELNLEVTLMNGGAVPALRFRQDEARVDFEKVEQLLKDDYLHWLGEQRGAQRKAKE